MMSDSYAESAGLLIDAYRGFFGFIDRILYGLLGLVYQLFFNVANSDIFANDTIMKFYSRVQLILGVFMLFQLAMIILRGIMNPDDFTKEGSGAGGLIKRVAIALFLLTALVPINIPSPQNEYEIQINNNGLLFGTLYSLQYRILENNTVGRLILGTNDSSDNYTSSNSNYSDSLKTASRIFTSSILKVFFRINLLPEDVRPDHCKDADDPAIYNDCRMCQTGVDALIDTYKQVDVDPDQLLAMKNTTCPDNGLLGVIGWISFLAGNEYYVFNYSAFISNIAAGIFIFIMLSFTIDIGVRAIKLAVLRLIAPIPIISYMDPKGTKDGAFNAWVKTLTTTYLDLFVRLALVYFVLFIIQRMMVDGLSIAGTGPVKWFSYVIIAISLFIFAKQAPKFIKQAIGLKDTDFRLFGGIKDALAVGSMAAGTLSGGVSGFASKFQSTNGNVGKKLLAGMFGGVGGVVGGAANAGKAYYGSKDANASTVMAANRKYAAQNYKNASDESTPFGRFKAGAQANLGLKNDLQKMDDKIKYYNAAESALGRINKSFDSDGDYKFNFDNGLSNKVRDALNNAGLNGNKYVNSAGDILDGNGNVIVKHGNDYSLKDMNDILNRVNSSGDNSLIKAVDEAKKTAQGVRFDQIRSSDRKTLSGNDAIIYDAAHTIYEVASKYSNETEFSRFKGNIGFDDPSLGWGSAFKHDAGLAGKTAEQIKNSNEYAQAQSNAQRVQDKKNS